MKIIALTLASLMSATTAPVELVSDEQKNNGPAVELTQEAARPMLGKEIIAQIREKYTKGDYDAFLKTLDASYHAAAEEGQLATLAQFRKGAEDDSQWIANAQKLIAERNQELLAAVADQQTPFAEQVRSAAANLTSPEQIGAISRLTSFHQMAPDTGKNSDENRLIALDLEYEYKMLHLESLKSNDPAFASKELPFALRMERMDRMLNLAQSFEDAELKATIEIASQNGDARMAQGWDLQTLGDLVRGKTSPSSDVEEKVVAIIQSHQEKVGEMTKVYFEANKATSNQ